MLNRYTFALLCATILVACSRSTVPSLDGGMGGSGGSGGGSGGAPETAYPCGFPDSPKIAACHKVIDHGLPYCGHDGPVPAPFDNCKAIPVAPDAGPDEWDWWCCPFS